MPVPRNSEATERPVDLVQTMSEQAAAVAREQVDLARQEMAAKARQAAGGLAMVGGGAFLAALASGTGTSGLVLLLAGRGRAAAAALGVTGAYAGAGALLAREGLGRLRGAGPMMPEETVQNAKQNLAPRSGGKPARKSAARSAPASTASKAKKATSAKPRAPRAKAPRTPPKPA
jgi:hypothetical protein